MKNQQDVNQKLGRDQAHIPDQSSLSALYPTPKTYDQRQTDRQETEARHLGRKPQHIATSTSLRLFGTLTTLLIFIAIVPRLIFWNVISGVSLSFLLGIIWFSLLYGVSKRISNDFEQLNLNAGPLFVAYLMSITPLLASCIALNSLLGANALPDYLLYTVIAGAHFTLAYILIRTITSTKLNNGQKLAALSGTVAFSILLGTVSITLQ